MNTNYLNILARKVSVAAIVARTVAEYSVTQQHFRAYDNISVLVTPEEQRFIIELSLGSEHIPIHFDAESVSGALKHISGGEYSFSCSDSEEDRQTIDGQFSRYRFTIDVVSNVEE